MHVVHRRLAPLFPGMVSSNFFTEYHGKNICDSFFGVISRWLSDAEKCERVDTIPDLIRVLKSKTSTSRNIDAQFIVYERPQGRGTVHKLKIAHFYLYMSFATVQGGGCVSGCVSSTFRGADYAVLEASECVEVDTRKTKYAPEHAQPADLGNVFGAHITRTLHERYNIASTVLNAQ